MLCCVWCVRVLPCVVPGVLPIACCVVCVVVLLIVCCDLAFDVGVCCVLV